MGNTRLAWVVVAGAACASRVEGPGTPRADDAGAAVGMDARDGAAGGMDAPAGFLDRDGMDALVGMDAVRGDTVGVDGPGAEVELDASPGDVQREDLVVDAQACPSGQGMCPTTAFMNEPVARYRCRALVAGRCPGPDLMIVERLIVDDTDGNVMHIAEESFTPASPEFMEGCVRGTGRRRLLAFNFAVGNIGDEDFAVGPPDERDTVHWEFSLAHRHFHVRQWAEYRLVTAPGMALRTGHKQSFCLEDNVPVLRPPRPASFPSEGGRCSPDPSTPVEERLPNGLSVGWADEYPAGLRCQWLDLGPADRASAGYLPDGDYDLVLSVNSPRGMPRLYREINHANNEVRVRVRITGNRVEALAGGR